MKLQTLGNGIIVKYPDSLDLRDQMAGGGLRADALGATVSPVPLFDAVAANPQFEVIGRIDIQGDVDAAGLAAMRDRATAEAVEMRVPVAPDQAAVVLSERDGVLHWQIAERIEDEPGALGLGAAAAPRRVAVFTEDYRPVVDADAAPQALGFAGKHLLKPLRKLILRFTARVAGQAVSAYLERNLREGPMQLQVSADGIPQWQAVDSFAEIMAGRDRARVLLFIHGTFSSSGGSFGALSQSDAGRTFLERALASYDAVIGFDHKTLTRPADSNALDLLAALGVWEQTRLEIDAVAFSRGGLVLRQLVEDLLPSRLPQHRTRKAVFVGCTNGGTLLADPQHWHELVDLYTNLISAAAMIGTSVVGPGVNLVSQSLQGLLSFVEYLASEAIDGEAVPGLSSMAPDGDLVAAVNRSRREVTPDRINYYVIEANFDQHLFDERQLRERGLGKQLFLELGDRLIDRLFQRAENDLVVDRDSMAHILPWAEQGWIRERFRCPPGNAVYHTVYFDDPGVVAKLQEWLVDGA